MVWVWVDLYGSSFFESLEWGLGYHSYIGIFLLQRLHSCTLTSSMPFFITSLSCSSLQTFLGISVSHNWLNSFSIFEKHIYINVFSSSISFLVICIYLSLFEFHPLVIRIVSLISLIAAYLVLIVLLIYKSCVVKVVAIYLLTHNYDNQANFIKQHLYLVTW